MKKFLQKSLLLTAFLPLVSYAQGFYGDYCAALPGLTFLLCRISSLLNAVIPVLLALGVVYFVFGVVQYVIGGDDEAKKKGKDRIVFGIIGLVIIVGLWGIVALVLNTFRSPYGGLDEYGAPYDINNRLLPPRQY